MYGLKKPSKVEIKTAFTIMELQSTNCKKTVKKRWVYGY